MAILPSSSWEGVGAPLAVLKCESRKIGVEGQMRMAWGGRAAVSISFVVVYSSSPQIRNTGHEYGVLTTPSHSLLQWQKLRRRGQ